MSKRVYAFGVNDAPYQVNKANEGKRCPYYIQWKNVMARCFSPAFQRNQPKYSACTIAAEWLSFMGFRSWMEQQDWKGKQLDKDILVEDNKHYSPETCVYVDRKTNMFFTTTKDREIPRGVHANGSNWRVTTNYGKVQHHGTFPTIDEALSVYEHVRYQEAIKLSKEQTDPRIVHILETRFLPKF